MGIDYGKRSIGIAVSDDSGTVAFPREIISWHQYVGDDLVRYAEQESVGGVVIGFSQNHQGIDNEITREVRLLADWWSAHTTIPCFLEREDFTSTAAQRPLVPEKNVTRSRVRKPESRADARAAALILQRYLDRLSKK